MLTHAEETVKAFEAGRISRRDLVARLVALGAALAGADALAQDAQPAGDATFNATGIDHIALSVTDIDRSRDWYMKHLGMTVRSQSRTSCFLNCGDNFVALFKADEPRMHHYSYALAEYDPADAVNRLREAGLEPDRQGNRVYFKDPDGLVVQVARG